MATLLRRWAGPAISVLVSAGLEVSPIESAVLSGIFLSVAAVWGLWIVTYEPVKAFLKARRRPAALRLNETIQNAPDARSRLSVLVSHDQERHVVWEKNGKCAVFRIEATNNEDRTLDDVYLRIGSLTATTDALTETARPLVGHNLAVASDPFDTARHPMERPRDSTTMHPGGSAIFDVVRLCKDASSNGRLMHGSYERHFHAVQMEQAGASTGSQAQRPRSAGRVASRQSRVRGVKGRHDSVVRPGSALSNVTKCVTNAIAGVMLPPVSYWDYSHGEMSEWLKEHAWKACVGVTLPWVRIPLSPPLYAI